MKNLRKKNPQLSYFRKNTQQAPDRWLDFDLNTRINLAAQFILLPVLEKSKNIAPEMLERIMPAAVDLERQASSLIQEEAGLFVSIRDLLEQTAGLFLLPAEDDFS